MGQCYIAPRLPIVVQEMGVHHACLQAPLVVSKVSSCAPAGAVGGQGQGWARTGKVA